MNRNDLTRTQLDVVTATEPLVLARGGPGTGKTTTALWAAHEALQQPGAPPWARVLFLTFSRTAVAQIARRAPSVLASGSGRIEIATFHGFAWRIIRAFGRYAGQGSQVPELQSESRAKLLGPQADALRYAQLLPAALRCLDSQKLSGLISRRWPLVICDEFQDTDDQQWQLLERLGGSARLLLLADPDQMIYGFRRADGVSEQRLLDAEQLANRVVDLEDVSHRDPSGVIPRMAAAIRRRDFADLDVQTAVAARRLRVYANVSDDQIIGTIRAERDELRANGHRSIGVFAHSNAGVADLAASMAEAKIPHVLVGIPEAHAEALGAMAALCEYAVGTVPEREVRIALASYMTSYTRGSNAPDLAVRLARGMRVENAIERNLTALLQAVRDAADGTIAELLTQVTPAWSRIGVTGGVRPWRRASDDLAALSRPVAARPVSAETVGHLVEAVARRRPQSVFEVEQAHSTAVQLMNFHQTKGREADAVILVYRDNDYLAERREREPFLDASRVLYVSLTRARQTVVVLLPTDPHPLVAPFEQYA